MMENLNNSDKQNSKILDLKTEEVSCFSSYGEVFVIEIKQDHLFEWWISCNICKDIFHSIENFLDHTTDMHFNKQSNEILKIRSEHFYSETINNPNCNENPNCAKLGNENVSLALSIVNIDHNYINTNMDENDISADVKEEDYFFVDMIESDYECQHPNESMPITHGSSKLEYVKTKSISHLDLKLDYSNKKIKKQEVKRLLCPYCDKTYTTKRRQEEHIATHLGLNPLFKCEECGAICASATNLKYHKRIHTGERPLKCTFCSKTFRARSAFSTHKLIHTGEKKYSCSFCGRNFRTKSECRIHERTHTGEKPFQCDKCGTCCISGASLTLHMRTHNAERLFKCNLCLKTFRTKAGLSTHIAMHTGEKKFPCAFCGKQFFTKINCRTHEKTHTGKKEYQKEEFQSSSILNVRNKKHKFKPFTFNINEKSCVEKNFKCTACPASFGTKKCLKQHERIHAKSKDYNCKICNESFLTYDSIRYHMIKKHERFPVPNCNYSLIGRMDPK